MLNVGLHTHTHTQLAPPPGPLDSSIKEARISAMQTLVILCCLSMQLNRQNRSLMHRLLEYLNESFDKLLASFWQDKMIWYLYLHVNLEETNLSANHCNCWYPSIKLHMISIGYPRIFIHCYSCREYYLLFALFISYQISMTLRANMRSSKKNTKTRKDGIRTGSVVEKKTHPLLLSVFIQLIGDTLSTKRLGSHRYHRLFGREEISFIVHQFLNEGLSDRDERTF